METIFWSRFKAICDERNTSPSVVCKENGLSTGNPTSWKNGRIPNKTIIQKFADYFGVSPEYFVGEAKEAPGAEPRAITDDDIKFAMFGTTEVSDELYQSVMNFAKVAQEMEARKKGG